MWRSLSLCLVLTLSINASPLPQFDRAFEVDGFIFDGPAGPAGRPPLLPKTTTTPTPRSTENPTRTVLPTGPERSTSSPACLASCQITPEFNPVCGTDNMEYTNPGALNCEAICGKDVSLHHYGTCSGQKFRG